MATLEGVRLSLANRTLWMQDQAKRVGATFTVNTGFRDYVEAVAIFLDRYTTVVIPHRPSAVWNGKRYYLKPGQSLAAVPGASLHSHMTNGVPDSLAVDLGCLPKWNSLRIELVQRAGLCTPVAGEPWHLQERAGAAQPIPIQPQESDPLNALPYIICPCPTGGFWELKKADGGIAQRGGAPFFGALPGRAKVVSPLVGMTACQRNGVVLGYWITDIEGHVYALGDAPYFTDYASHPEWHNPNRRIAGIVQTSGINKGERIRYAQIGIEAGDADFVVDTYDIGLEMKAQ